MLINTWGSGLKAYQEINFLKTKDPESIPGNILSQGKGSRKHTRQYTFLSQRILNSYQAIDFLMVKDFEIIPGNILSYDGGF